MNNNLVIVRAGKNSLHQNWLDRPYSERSFDTLISFYDTDAFTAFTPKDGVTAVLQDGGKWDSIQKGLRSVNWRTYDYFWLPDDDVLIDGSSVEKMFALSRDYGLTISQPTLTRDSYFTFLGLIGADPFLLRYTNFVEVMAPCLHRDVIAEVIDLMDVSPSGFGLDKIWSRLAGSGRDRVALLDGVRMRHTRPVGSVLVKELKSKGRDIDTDLRNLGNRFENYKKLRKIDYAAIMADGTRLDGKIAVARRAAVDWLAHRAEFIDDKNIAVESLQIIKRHLLYSDGLTTTLRRKSSTQAHANACPVRALLPKDKIVPQAFLINLDGSSERLKQASAQLQDAGLLFERVSAFDGRGIDLSLQDDAESMACVRFMGRPLRGGEYGCYKSHLACAQKIVEAKLDYALVFEDDIVLSPAFARVLTALIKYLKSARPDFDVVHLAPDRIKYFSPVRTLPDEHSLVAAHYFPMTTSALLWSYEGAKRFIEENSTIRMPVDNQLRETLTRSGRGLALWPAVARQLGNDSDIDGHATPRKRDGRHWSYGLLKQRRLLVNKGLALYHMAIQRLRMGTE